MHKKREGWNVVLAGFWNRMIFTPEWVQSHLFATSEQLETVVALLPILPIIYRDNQIVVEISATRIVCRARDLDSDEALRRSGAAASTILEALPETPIQGVGVNFAFREAAPAANLLNLFDFADNPRWAEAGWETGERKIVRQLTRDADTLNLTLTFNAGRLDIDCNFHTVPDKNAAAVAAVAPERLVELRDKATHTIQELYGLELEGDDDGA